MKSIKLVLVVLFSIAIVSCGGGGGTTPTTTTTTTSGKVTLSGTVAQGAAIASATITIKDKNGSTTTGTTGTGGKYTIDVTGKTAPFLMKVPAGTGYLYSVATATATGTANIHPFTDLIIRNWYKVQGSDVETDFSGTGALAKFPTATEINTIEAVIRNILSANLTSVGMTTSNFNLLTSSFDADHTGFDKVLDNTRVAVSTTGAVTVTATDPTTGITGTVVSTDLTTDLSVADTTLPSDPTGLSAIPAGATSIVLVWNASTDNVGVAGYNIYRDGTKVGTSPYPVYSDTGLTSSTNYCYQVEAFDGAGNVSAGKSASVCGTTLAAADATAPSAPTVLMATVASASQIDLSWTASTSTDVAGYAIYRNTVKVAAVNGTSYSDTGLSSGTTYSYTVKALDGALNYSAASNTASATTTVDVTGTWTASMGGTIFTNESGTGQTTWLTLAITQSGSTVSGTWSYSDTLGRSGTIAISSAAISANILTFYSAEPDTACASRTVTWTATVTSTAPGSQLIVANTAPASGTCVAMNGSLTFTKQAGTGVSQFDGTYTGSWSITCPVCGDTAAGTVTATLVNGVFTSISLPITSGTHGPLFVSGTASSSGAITGTGASPSQCSSVSTFTGQIVATSSGGEVMTMTYSRPASGTPGTPNRCEAESGTITATRT